MPKNVYSEINLHMTWHTKNDDPVLTAEIESRVHHYLENKIRETKDVIFMQLAKLRITFTQLCLCRRAYWSATG